MLNTDPLILGFGIPPEARPLAIAPLVAIHDLRRVSAYRERKPIAHPIVKVHDAVKEGESMVAPLESSSVAIRAGSPSTRYASGSRW